MGRVRGAREREEEGGKRGVRQTIKIHSSINIESQSNPSVLDNCQFQCILRDRIVCARVVVNFHILEWPGFEVRFRFFFRGVSVPCTFGGRGRHGRHAVRRAGPRLGRSLRVMLSVSDGDMEHDGVGPLSASTRRPQPGAGPPGSPGTDSAGTGTRSRLRSRAVRDTCTAALEPIAARRTSTSHYFLLSRSCTMHTPCAT